MDTNWDFASSCALFLSSSLPLFLKLGRHLPQRNVQRGRQGAVRTVRERQGLFGGRCHYVQRLRRWKLYERRIHKRHANQLQTVHGGV